MNIRPLSVLKVRYFLLAGLLMSAGYAPFSIWFLLPVGISLWVHAVRRSKTLSEAALGSLITSSVFFLIVLHWSSTYVGWFPWVALALFEALFLAPVGMAMRLFKDSRWLPLLLGGSFVLDEAIRSRIPWGGFGWARIAFVQPSYFTKIASIGGAPLLTFSIATLSGLLVVGFASKGNRSHLIFIPILLILPIFIPSPQSNHFMNIAAIQGDVPRLGLDFNAQREAVLQYHVTTTKKLAERIRRGVAPTPSVIVWPENASDVDPIHDVHARTLITRLTDEVDVPILVGGVAESPTVQNISVLWIPRIGPTSIYIKQHLAPFGEYLPLRNLAELLVPAAKRIVDMAPGTATVTHRVGDLRMADVICFEIIEDELVRGAIIHDSANILVVQTNSATFGRSAESVQQLAVSRERAIEHGRSVISVSTSGQSALIEPSGKVVQKSAFFTSAILQANMPVTTVLTLSDRLGRWPELVIILLMLAAFATRLARKVRK